MEAERKEHSLGTAEKPTTQKKEDTRHRQNPRGQQELTQAGAKFLETFFSSAVLGSAPLRKTPAVSSLDTDPGVATLALPTACWRAPTPVNKWPRLCGCCCCNSQRSGRRKEWDAADKRQSPRRPGGGEQVMSSTDAVGETK